jgi:hypothetical protein
MYRHFYPVIGKRTFWGTFFKKGYNPVLGVRTVSLASKNTPLQVIPSRWYCSVTALAYRACRKEIFHLMTDVFEVDVVISQREARAAANVPTPTSGRQYAGFFYFHEVLILKLQTENQTFY